MVSFVLGDAKHDSSAGWERASFLGSASQTLMHHPLMRLCCKSKFKLLQKFMVQPNKSLPSALLLCPLCQSRDYHRNWLRGDGEEYFPSSLVSMGNTAATLAKLCIPGRIVLLQIHLHLQKLREWVGLAGLML